MSDDVDECDCWSVPGARHLDADGHLPHCQQSMAYAFDIAQAEERAQLITVTAERNELHVALRNLLAAWPRLGHEHATMPQQEALNEAKRLVGEGE